MASVTLIHGPRASGKTTLALALCDSLRSSGCTPLLVEEYDRGDGDANGIAYIIQDPSSESRSGMWGRREFVSISDLVNSGYRGKQFSHIVVTTSHPEKFPEHVATFLVSTKSKWRASLKSNITKE